MKHLDAASAFKNSKRENADWQAVMRSGSREVWPDTSPSFAVSAGDEVFTIGSCFARNIEKHLAHLGCKVPVMEFDIPEDERRGAHPLNKYSVSSFQQEIAWAASIYDRDGVVTAADCGGIGFECGDGTVIDLQFGAFVPVTRERFVARRQQLYNLFARAFTAKCVVATPGLIEAWFDTETGFCIHSAPVQRQLLRSQSRFVMQVLDYGRCVADLNSVVSLIRERNQDAKILITVSPVPMQRTFTTDDVVIANMNSKSVLRAACQAVVQSHENVDYFPSFESVMLSYPEYVWESDRVHVKDEFIGKVVRRMLTKYIKDLDPSRELVQSAHTLAAAGDDSAALGALRGALEIDPSNGDARLLYISGLLKDRQMSEAEAECRAMLQAEPVNRDARTLLARILVRTGRHDEALAEVDQLLASGDLTPVNLHGAARTLVQAGHHGRGEELLRRLIELQPGRPTAYLDLANLYLKSSNRVAARDTLTDGIKHCRRKRRTDELFALLINLHITQGAVIDADLLLAEGMRRFPESPALHELGGRLPSKRAVRGRQFNETGSGIK